MRSVKDSNNMMIRCTLFGKEYEVGEQFIKFWGQRSYEDWQQQGRLAIKVIDENFRKQNPTVYEQCQSKILNNGSWTRAHN
jgi:hypothetical protein